MTDTKKKKQKKILVVEDHPALSQALMEKLTAEGFEAIQARDGEEGLTMAFMEHPDLILLDIIMPKVDGATMLKQLRADAWGSSVPVVVLSNVEFFGGTEESDLSSEVSDYLIKTKSSLEDVLKKVKESLRNNEPEES